MSTLLQDYFSTILARDGGQAAELAATEAGTVSCTAIESVAAFEALGDEWTALYARAGRSQQIFQSYAWNRVWVDHYITHKTAHCNCRLAVVAVRRAGRLVMVWPLVVQRLMGLTQLIWMGYGVTQYGDVLMEPGTDAAVVQQSWRFLTGHFKADLLSLRKVRDDSAIAPFLSGLGGRKANAQSAPFLDLASAPDFAAFENRYSGKARKNRRRLMRRLGESGTVDFIHAGPGPDARALTLRAIEMKRDWLLHRQTFGAAIRDEQFSDFFADFAALAEAGPQCRASAITLDGAPIAIMIGVADQGRFAGHVFAYDLAHEKSGAGVLLLEELIREGYRKGDTSLDLMAPADAYKLEWSDAAVPVCDWARPLTAAGSVYCRVYLERLREPLKRRVEALPPGLRKIVLAAFYDHSWRTCGESHTGEGSGSAACGTSGTLPSSRGTPVAHAGPHAL